MKITAYEITERHDCGCFRDVYAKLDIFTKEFSIKATKGGCLYHESKEVVSTQEEDELVVKSLLEQVRRRPVHTSVKPQVPAFLFNLFKHGFQVVIKPKMYDDYLSAINPIGARMLQIECERYTFYWLFDADEIPVHPLEIPEDRLFVDADNWIIKYEYLVPVKNWALEYREILLSWIKENLEERLRLWEEAEEFLLKYL